MKTWLCPKEVLRFVETSFVCGHLRSKRPPESYRKLGLGLFGWRRSPGVLWGLAGTGGQLRAQLRGSPDPVNPGQKAHTGISWQTG